MPDFLTDDQVAAAVQDEIKPGTKMAFNATATFTRIGTNQWAKVSDDEIEGGEPDVERGADREVP